MGIRTIASVAVATLAVAGAVTASTVTAEPAKAGVSGQQVQLAIPDKTDPNYIAPDQVLTAAEGIALKQRIAKTALAPQWRWMGNFGNVYDVAAVANTPPVAAAGGIMVEMLDNGLMPTWMYY